MNAGKIILDIRGEDKKKLTVEALLEAFAKAGSDGAANDKMLLI